MLQVFPCASTARTAQTCPSASRIGNSTRPASSVTCTPIFPSRMSRVHHRGGDGHEGLRFTEEQIIGILHEQEAGQKTADVCRRHGISEATFYKWKAKFGGLEVSNAKRLKALEVENAKLKKLLAETMLDNAMLRDLNSKKW